MKTTDEASFRWEEDFPKGYGHTSIAYLRRCFGYEDAKQGNIHAASDVVKRCVKQKRLDRFREEYAEAFVLPVNSQNALPKALAKEIGLKLWDKIILTDDVKRKQLPAIQRLQHKPVFSGVIRCGTEYVIVDDVITQGGTIAALRKYVLSNGGKVVAVMALAYSIGSYDIAPTSDKYMRLLSKFGMAVFWMKEVGLVSSYEELTNSQARYLLKFSSAKNIHRKMVETGCPEVGDVEPHYLLRR
jgi:hypothetical protein